MKWQCLGRRGGLICYSCNDCGYTVFASAPMLRELLKNGTFSSCVICQKMEIEADDIRTEYSSSESGTTETD
jgi:hypothetical protein